MIRRLVALSAVLAALLVEVSGIAAAVGHPRPVTAYDQHGHRLPNDPRLGSGEAVTLIVLGFAARTSVTVADANRRTRREVRADQHGTVRVHFQAPHRSVAGRANLVAFTGVPNGGYRHSAASGNTAVGVPLLRRFVYRRAFGHGIKGQHHEPGGGLAGTGFDALALLIAAAAAIALGALGLRASRGTGSGASRPPESDAS